jgi:TonB family protein
LLRESTETAEPVQDGTVGLEGEEYERREASGMLSSGPVSDPQVGSNVVETPPPLQEAAPLYRENERPVYPRIARQRGYEGTVLLDVLVTREGRAVEVDVAKSCGHRILDEAAQEAVREWRFEPAKRGDEAVEMRVRIPVRFRLQ